MWFLFMFIPYAISARIFPTQTSISTNENGNITLEWSLKPMHGEISDWISIFHQSDEDSLIRPLWHDSTGLTKFGEKKFQDSFSVNYAKNSKKVSATITNVKDSMIVYLTAVFMDKNGQIVSGPIYSKFKIRVGYIQLTDKPICYGARDKTPASFSLTLDGTLKAIKLRHISGSVHCSVGKLRNYWGCGSCCTGSLMTIITNSSDKAIIPLTGTYLSYPAANYIPNYGGILAPEIVLPVPLTSRSVAKGAVMKIWYTEDLYHSTVSDNGGTHCVLVFAMYS
ncbi:uncharacterized protein [Clytia hemisphaerica]